jgi:hypothetical protein
MPTAETTHLWTAAANSFQVSGEMREADRAVIWLRDEEANRQGTGIDLEGRAMVIARA